MVFGYDLGGRVLHGVSFSVSGGQTVALVGATGSGKVRCHFRTYRGSKSAGASSRAFPVVRRHVRCKHSIPTICRLVWSGPSPQAGTPDVRCLAS